MSSKYTLNKEDGKKILKGAGIALAGALLTYLAQILPQVDFGQYNLVIAPVLSILINAGLKFFSSR